MTKIQSGLNSFGLWVENADGVICSAFDDIGGEGGRYIVNYHRGEMPAYHHTRHHTLTEVESQMRAFEPDLRRWHTTPD